jgi:hypothetical protein
MTLEELATGKEFRRGGRRWRCAGFGTRVSLAGMIKEACTRNCHAILVFGEPICGPELIGAGRFRGYGASRPMNRESERATPLIADHDDA